MAERKIQRLRQTGLAAEYTAKFRQLSAQLGWGDAPLIAAYYHRLKERVKDEIARQDRPDNLGKIIGLAIKIDNRQYKQELEKKY